MSWVCERMPATITPLTTTTKLTTTTTSGLLWKKVFLSLKGSDLFLYETPPVSHLVIQHAASLPIVHCAVT